MVCPLKGLQKELRVACLFVARLIDLFNDQAARLGQLVYEASQLVWIAARRLGVDELRPKSRKLSREFDFVHRLPLSTVSFMRPEKPPQLASQKPFGLMARPHFRSETSRTTRHIIRLQSNNRKCAHNPTLTVHLNRQSASAIGGPSSAA